VGVRPRTYVSLASGYGGLDKAVRDVFGGARCLCYVEIEVTVAATLVARMETGDLDEAPVWTDARTFDGRPLRGRCDLLVGGYPCQPYSVAGKGLGADDPRDLWPSVSRIVGEMRPAVVFFENVSAHLVRGFERVGEDLQELGYQCTVGLVRASDIKAPHKRERLFILGWLADAHGDGLGRGAQPHIGAKARVTAPRRADAPRCGTTLGNTLRDGGERRGAAGHLEGAAGCPESERDQRERGRGAAGDHGPGDDRAPLADCHGGRLGERPDPTQSATSGWRERKPESRCLNSNGEALGEAQSLGHAIGGGLRRGLGAEQPPADGAGDSLVGLPDWPPLPDDDAGWRAVLERWPWLAPALPEPGIRLVADAGPIRDRLDVSWTPCDCHRGDQLRGLGNGVVPPQAAAALCTLWTRAFGVAP
jgi:DNA (cytosine-5)-methyltransferase 1